MSDHFHNFKCWHKEVLESLYSNENAGFVLLIATFPLLERYLREKSGAHENKTLPPAFYAELRKILPALPDDDVADQFWHVYRNGLLHQVTLSMGKRKSIKPPIGWLGSKAEILTLDPSGNFWVHPVKFARKVIKVIEADFATFEGTHSTNHPLPLVDPLRSGTSSASPKVET